MSIRVPEPLRAQIDAIAETERRSASQVVLILLEEALGTREGSELAALRKGLKMIATNVPAMYGGVHVPVEVQRFAQKVLDEAAQE